MLEKVGRVIAFGDGTASILEEGGGRKIYRFAPKKVKGNLHEHDEQCLNYPARLMDRVVNFVVDDTSGEVTSVSIFVPSFATYMCQDCDGRCYTMAAKMCECGNLANSVFKQCEACAVEKGECAACGKKLKQGGIGSNG